jgi:hypothetical protein
VPSCVRRGQTAAEGTEDVGEGGAAPGIAQMYIEAAERLGPPTPTGPQWRSLGPWTVPDGQMYGASRINISVRISAIAIDPRNPAHVLCGAANGGVWESRDRGASWAPRIDYAATLTVGAVALTPAIPLLSTAARAKGTGRRSSALEFCVEQTAGLHGRLCAPCHSLDRASMI